MRPGPPATERIETLLSIALLCLGAVCVFRGALSFYFAQEDFRGLAVAVGVYPRHAHLWRYISVQAFMDVFYPVFRDQAWPYHAVSLGLHCLNAGLLFTLLARRSSRSAALVGTSFFAAHPALFTALYWQSARADILAATFALLTVILVLRPGRERWLALPAYALSLLSKESTLPLPVVIAVLLWWRGGRQPGTPASRPARVDWLLVLLFLMGASYLLALVGSKAGIQVGFDSRSAYALDFGGPVLRNLLTYIGWTADLAMLRPGLRFVDRQNPAIFPFAIGVLVAAGLLSLWPALRKRVWLVGILAHVLLLVPVLPLRNHTYHYYLYAALMAGALCLAALTDVVVGAAIARWAPSMMRKARTKLALEIGAAWVVAAMCWVALTWNGARLVKQIETRPSAVYPGLRGDPIVDRTLIAERAIRSLRAAPIPNGTELVLILRERIALIARIVRGSGEAPPPQESYPESNMRVALFDGIGVRALVPAVDSVSFVIALGQPTARRRYGVYAPTGEVEVYAAAALDSLLASSWVTRW